MEYEVPGVGKIVLKTVVFDLNGTLAVYGNIKESTKVLLNKMLGNGFEVVLLTSDQRGIAVETASELNIKCVIAKTSDDKENFMSSLDFQTTVAIGNARVDIGMFKHSKIRIATIQQEGIHTGILNYVDIMVNDVDDAIKLLLDKDTFASTMKV
ncbi:MAG: HAD family hydrolase [Marinilabiliales bacterium]